LIFIVFGVLRRGPYFLHEEKYQTKNDFPTLIF
jgi:hypothetical protein